MNGCLLVPVITLDASHQTQTACNTNDSFCMGVSFEAVHDEIDFWCFVPAISKFFLVFMLLYATYSTTMSLLVVCMR